MKILLLVSIFIALAIVVPMPAMARADINAGIFLPPTIAFESHPKVKMMSDTGGVFVVADAAADIPKESPTGKDEEQKGQFMEKGKPTESEGKSNWKINVWPVKPADNVKSLPQMKEENKHVPPDRE